MLYVVGVKMEERDAWKFFDSVRNSKYVDTRVEHTFLDVIVSHNIAKDTLKEVIQNHSEDTWSENVKNDLAILFDNLIDLEVVLHMNSLVQ